MMGPTGIGGRSEINVTNAMLIGWGWCFQVSRFLETWKVGTPRPVYCRRALLDLFDNGEIPAVGPGQETPRAAIFEGAVCGPE